MDILQRVLARRKEGTEKSLIFLDVQFQCLFAFSTQFKLAMLGQNYSLELLDCFLSSHDFYLCQYHSSTQVKWCYFSVAMVSRCLDWGATQQDVRGVGFEPTNP